MSEYQYHEWQTVDRLLTPAERAAVNQLSSHIEVSSSKASVSYNWGDFKHDPRQVLLKYFDAYFYVSNWGSIRLMYRFPKGMIDQKELSLYLDSEMATFATYGDYEVLDIDFHSDEGGWMEEADFDLSDFISLRADLLQGDFRLLYLMWLMQTPFYDESEDDVEDEDEDYVDDDEDDEEEGHRNEDLEPPVPPGLKKLTPAYDSIMKIFDIDPFLVQAAAEKSPDLRDLLAVDYRELIGRLSRSECEDFLTRLAEGDVTAGTALRKRIGEFLPKDLPAHSTGTRSVAELQQRAAHLAEVEKKRRTEETRKKHIAEMKSLAERETQVWQDVDRVLTNGTKSAAVYDEATALLEKLEQLSEFQGTRARFLTGVRQLAEKFSPRPSLLKRWNERSWL